MTGKLNYIFYFPLLITAAFVIESSICCLRHKCPKVLLVSFDGFRWDYLNRTATPNFDYLINNGVHATKGLQNAFITKTLPNHYTIVTGLYEESHGMVANTFYDPKLNEVFEFWNKTQASESKWFDNGGEPIWVTNQKQCETCRSGIVFWPGDSASVEEYLPSRYLPFNPETPFKSRIDYIISWFTTKQAINLGLLYFEEPDGYGHRFGPESENVTNMIKTLDSHLGYLLQRLNETGLINEMNLIITSDHGMASTPEDKVINLDNYINFNSYKMFSSNPVGNILPNPGVSVEEIKKNLSSILHIKVYEKSEIPKRFHYSSNPRIQPILIVADEGYSLKHNGSNVPLGNHGYDVLLPSMHPIFMAMGPSFKKGYKKNTFHNVDIYPLLCHLLGVIPSPNNGSIQSVKDLLLEEESKNSLGKSVSDTTVYVYLIILMFIVCVGAIFSLGVCIQTRSRRLHTLQRSHFSGTKSSSTQYRTDSHGKFPLLHGIASDSEEEF